VSAVDGVKRRLAAARARSRLLDHLIATFEHYGKVEGSVLAGAVTFFGFLSFFPVLAIAFAVVGVITGAYPDAEESVTKALTEVFPGMIGEGKGKIDPASFEDAAATAGVIGLVTLLYTGLGWLSALRQALQDVFELPRSKAHNFFVGKLVDLVMLAVIGLVLVVSVAMSSATRGFVDEITEVMGIDDVSGIGELLNGVGTLLGLLASMVMFYASFRLLAKPSVSSAALWRGALLAAIGFEVLKQLAAYLIGATKDNPAFAVFGTALILVVWINYFSRLLLIGAAWAATAEPAIRPAAVSAGPAATGTAGAAAPAAAATTAAVGVDDEDADEDADERIEAAVELVRSAAVVIGVTWMLRRIMRQQD
jgi:membrane protein